MDYRLCLQCPSNSDIELFICSTFIQLLYTLMSRSLKRLQFYSYITVTMKDKTCLIVIWLNADLSVCNLCLDAMILQKGNVICQSLQLHVSYDLLVCGVVFTEISNCKQCPLGNNYVRSRPLQHRNKKNASITRSELNDNRPNTSQMQNIS